MGMICLSLLVLCSLGQYPNHPYYHTREMLLLAREREVPPPPPSPWSCQVTGSQFPVQAILSFVCTILPSQASGMSRRKTRARSLSKV